MNRLWKYIIITSWLSLVGCGGTEVTLVNCTGENCNSPGQEPDQPDEPSALFEVTVPSTMENVTERETVSFALTPLSSTDLQISINWEVVDAANQPIAYLFENNAITFTAPSVDVQEEVRYKVSIINDADGSTVEAYNGTITVTPKNNIAPSLELENTSAIEGSEVTISPVITDPDSPELTYEWQLISGPDVHLAEVHSSNISFIAPTYQADNSVIELKLTVVDEELASTDGTISISLKDIPQVDAGKNQIVSANSAVSLTSSATDSSGISGYKWSQSTEDTLQLTLEKLDTETLTFTAPDVSEPTTLSFTLEVTDNDGISSIDTVDVVVMNYTLAKVEDLNYQGAIKVANNVWGESGSDYANGAIAYNKKNNSLFFVGKDIAISEIPLVDFIDQGESESVIDLNIAEPLQNFYKLSSRIPEGNPTTLNHVSGLTLYNDKLFVNLATFYDAAIQSVYTTMLINNPDDLANMEVSSLYEVEGRVHAAGWFTDVPSEWQPIIGSSHIAGHAANFSIDARHSMGPSAFGINLDDFENNPNTETPDFISTSKLLDYPLANPLSDDGYNESGTNELWVQLSQAYIGFIVPNTYTYMVIGHSGGHESGLGYKITQTNGALCPGACPYDHLDYHNYYWLYDMNDLVEVKKGLKEAFDVKPYDYGVFNTPYRMNKAGDINPIRGATFDPDTGSLYLLLRNAGQVGNYDRPPLVLKYHIDVK